MTSIVQGLPLSYAASVEPTIRLFRRIRARVERIQWQVDRLGRDISPSVSIVAKRTIADLLEFQGRLVEYSIKDNTRLEIQREFDKFGSVDAHLTAIFGDDYMPIRPGKRSPLLRSLLLRARMVSCTARQRELFTRFRYELMERHHAGWYVIFNTLTVSDWYFDDVFSQNSLVFRDYVRSVDRAVAARCYGSFRLARGKEYHRYFAVVEQGSKTGRLHLHVVHMVKELPFGCSDPNLGRRIPYCREITGFKRFWTVGYSAPISVRFGAGDAFGKAGWRWPAVNGGDKWLPYRSGNVGSLAGYMCKYIVKAYTEKRGNYIWRTRMTHGLGMKIPRAALMKMPTSRLLVLTGALPTKRLMLRGKMYPLGILKREATRLIIQRMRSKPHRMLAMSKSLTLLHPRPSLVTQYRDLIAGKPIRNLRSIGIMRTMKLMSMAISDVVFEMEKAAVVFCGVSPLSSNPIGAGLQDAC